MSRSVSLSLLSGALLAAPLAALGAPGDACLRYVLLSPDAGGAAGIPLNINLTSFGDGGATAVDTAVNYGVATDYTGVPPGSYDAALSVFGSPVTTLTPLLPEPGTYTLLLTGVATETDATSLLRSEARLLNDDITLASPGQARVRFFHASPDAPRVDITTADGVTLFDDVPYLNSTGYLDLAAGTYDLEVRDASGEVVILAVPGVELASGSVYTVYAAGRAEATPGQADLSAVISLDAPNDCSPQNFTGIWFDLEQQGQGIQLVQGEGETTLQGVLYTYGLDGTAAWFTFTGAELDAEGVATADLFAATGSPLGSPFDPMAVMGELVGSVNIDCSAIERTCDVTATVNGAERALTITVFPQVVPLGG
ncbi:MAG: DUF4397 domain-containing protein [Candidatus Competibacterales bacterium]